MYPETGCSAMLKGKTGLFVCEVTATRRALCGFGLITNVATLGAYVRFGATWGRKHIKNRRIFLLFLLGTHIILTAFTNLLLHQTFITLYTVERYRWCGCKDPQ